MTSLLVGQLTRLPFHPGYATGWCIRIMVPTILLVMSALAVADAANSSECLIPSEEIANLTEVSIICYLFISNVC